MYALPPGSLSRGPSLTGSRRTSSAGLTLPPIAGFSIPHQLKQPSERDQNACALGLWHCDVSTVSNFRQSIESVVCGTGESRKPQVGYLRGTQQSLRLACLCCYVGGFFNRPFELRKQKLFQQEREVIATLTLCGSNMQSVVLAIFSALEALQDFALVRKNEHDSASCAKLVGRSPWSCTHYAGSR